MRAGGRAIAAVISWRLRVNRLRDRRSGPLSVRSASEQRFLSQLLEAHLVVAPRRQRSVVPKYKYTRDG